MIDVQRGVALSCRFAFRTEIVAMLQENKTLKSLMVDVCRFAFRTEIAVMLQQNTSLETELSRAYSKALDT
jgi:hypothetical protein